MVLRNIELYEALKKDLSEDSARMIAEVVPAAGDVATKSDVQEVHLAISRLETRMSEFEAKLERRINRWGAFFVVPLWGAAVAGTIRFIVGT